jgi:hypothetical protein
VPSNLLKTINNGNLINNDPSCSPLTRETMSEALKIAVDDSQRAGRAVALIPKIRVELYPNALATIRDETRMEGRLPLYQRFRALSEQEPFDLTPYLSTIQVSKAVAPGSLGTCSIKLKRNVHATASLAAHEALDPVNNPDRSSNEWLQLVEDNDVIVVHLEVGVANTAQEFEQRSGGDLVQSMEFTTTATLGDDKAGSRYSVARVGRAAAPMVFFGFVDSVRRVRTGNGLGGATFEYSIQASDFSKCMSSRVPTLVNERAGSEVLRKRAGLPQIPNMPIDIACAHLLRGLLQARVFSAADLSSVETTLLRVARERAVSSDASSAPVSEETLAAIAKENDQSIRLNKLLFEIMEVTAEADRDLLSQLGENAAPSKFLLPSTLTDRFGAFDRKRIAGLAPVASLLGGSTGAQLGELMTVHTGYAGQLVTHGENIPVDYSDLTKEEQAPMSGNYDVPSYLSVVPNELFRSLGADLRDGVNLDDVLRGLIGDTMGAVEYRYDLCDYYGASLSPNDNNPITLPALFIHSRSRPLNAISDFEINAHLEGHSDDDSPKKRWAQEHQLSLLEWASIPINLISETDIVTESLQRDGSGRATLLHSSLNSNVSLMASIQASKGQNTLGTTTGTPLFYAKPAELVHGYLPRDYQSQGVTDQTAIGAGLVTAAATNVVFTKHRDDILSQPIELKGTIVIACLLPAARVGQRLAIFRPERNVGTLEEFKTRWQSQHLYGLHPDFLDATLADPNSKEAVAKIQAAVDKIIKSNSNFKSRDVFNEVQNSVSESLLDIDGAIFRSWFFAHFDCFLIEEVTHGVEVSPQDGTIQATTALVVSYGAMGRETPAMLSTLPALSNLVHHLDLNEKRVSNQRPQIKLNSKPQVKLTPDEAPAEDEIKALTSSLNRAGYFPTFIDRWRSSGSDAALFRDVEANIKELTLIQGFMSDMSSLYLFNPDAGDVNVGGKKTNLVRMLDGLASRDPLKKPTKISFPALLRKTSIYAQLNDVAAPIAAQSRGATAISYWKDGEREVYLPKGRYAVVILQTEIPRIVEQAEADLRAALERYIALKAELAESMNT